MKLIILFFLIFEFLWNFVIVKTFSMALFKSIIMYTGKVHIESELTKFKNQISKNKYLIIWIYWLGKYQTINNKLKKFIISHKKSIYFLSDRKNGVKLEIKNNQTKRKQDDDAEELNLGKTYF